MRSPRASAGREVARAAVTELRRLDLDHPGARRSGDLDGAVARSGVDHQHLDRGVDALARDRVEHLRQVARPVLDRQHHRDGRPLLVLAHPRSRRIARTTMRAARRRALSTMRGPRAGHQPLEVDAGPFEPVGLALQPLHLGRAALPQLAQLALALRQRAARCRQLRGKALVCVFGRPPAAPAASTACSSGSTAMARTVPAVAEAFADSAIASSGGRSGTRRWMPTKQESEKNRKPAAGRRRPAGAAATDRGRDRLPCRAVAARPRAVAGAGSGPEGVHLLQPPGRGDRERVLTGGQAEHAQQGGAAQRSPGRGAGAAMRARAGVARRRGGRALQPPRSRSARRLHGGRRPRLRDGGRSSADAPGSDPRGRGREDLRRPAHAGPARRLARAAGAGRVAADRAATRTTSCCDCWRRAARPPTSPRCSGWLRRRCATAPRCSTAGSGFASAPPRSGWPSSAACWTPR